MPSSILKEILFNNVIGKDIIILVCMVFHVTYSYRLMSVQKVEGI